MSFVNPFLKSFFCYWEGEDKKKKQEEIYFCVSMSSVIIYLLVRKKGKKMQLFLKFERISFATFFCFSFGLWEKSKTRC